MLKKKLCERCFLAWLKKEFSKGVDNNREHTIIRSFMKTFVHKWKREKICMCFVSKSFELLTYKETPEKCPYLLEQTVNAK